MGRKPKSFKMAASRLAANRPGAGTRQSPPYCRAVHHRELAVRRTNTLNILISLLVLSACTGGGPAKRATEDEGPVSVRARNALADENPEGLVKVAEGFERAGNYAGANRLYGQAMAAAPGLVAAQVGYARTLLHLGHGQEAGRILEGLYAKHAGDERLVLALVQGHVKAGEFAEAEKKLRPLAQAEGAGVGVLDMRGRLLQVLGKVPAAREMFDRALARAPQNTLSLRHLALSFALDGEYETAVALLQRAMDSPAAQAEAKKALAYVYALSGQRKAAGVIAMSATTPEELTVMEFLFDLLPRMNEADRAAALMFDRVPAGVLKQEADN
jgi:Flp pilus assembly protein TadD